MSPRNKMRKEKPKEDMNRLSETLGSLAPTLATNEIDSTATSLSNDAIDSNSQTNSSQEENRVIGNEDEKSQMTSCLESSNIDDDLENVPTELKSSQEDHNLSQKDHNSLQDSHNLLKDCHNSLQENQISSEDCQNSLKEDQKSSQDCQPLCQKDLHSHSLSLNLQEDPSLEPMSNFNENSNVLENEIAPLYTNSTENDNQFDNILEKKSSVHDFYTDSQTLCLPDDLTEKLSQKDLYSDSEPTNSQAAEPSLKPTSKSNRKLAVLEKLQREGFAIPSMPKLSGSPDAVITLDDDDNEKDEERCSIHRTVNPGVQRLMERLLQHSTKKKPKPAHDVSLR